MSWSRLSTQLSKLIDVIKIIDLTGEDRVHRELALIKVKRTPENRPILLILLKFSGLISLMSIKKP